MRNRDSACVVVDGSPLRYLYTGLGQFSYHLLEELGKVPAADFRLIALVHPRFANRLPPGIDWTPANWLRRHAPPALQSRLFPGCDVWHMTTENTRLTGVPQKARVILTIHGLHFLDEAQKEEAARELAHVQSLVNRASVITVVSKFTEGLVRDRLTTGSRSIEVIPNGISRFHGAARRPAWAPSRKFLFTVGTFFDRKNYLVLLPMMHHLPDYDLVIAGDDNRDYGREVRSAVAMAGLQARVRLPGEVAETEKQWLYENGEAYLFPSLSEGFGIPVIETFQLGKPVFCSRHGSLPEIGSSFAFYWDTFDPAAMARLVDSKLAAENESLRNARRVYAAEFTWSRAALRYKEIYRSLF